MAIDCSLTAPPDQFTRVRCPPDRKSPGRSSAAHTNHYDVSQHSKDLTMRPYSLRPSTRTRRPIRRLRLQNLEDRTVPAIVTWDGGGGDFNWNNAANWSGDV